MMIVSTYWQKITIDSHYRMADEIVIMVRCVNNDD